MELFGIFDTISAFAYSMSFGLFDSGDLVQNAEVYTRGLWASLFLTIPIYLAILVLGGIGLMRMAKGEKKKYAALGFFPILNTWYAGYIAGESFFFGQKMKRAGLYAAILEGFYAVVWGLNTFLKFMKYMFPMQKAVEGGYKIVADVGVFPQQIRWLFGAETEIWLTVMSMLLLFAVTIFLVVMFNALFRKYFARSPMLMTLLSAVFPFRGIAIFAVRNNKPVDYQAYIRQRVEAMRRQQQYGPYGPYGQGPYGGGPQKPEEPFSDFGDSNGGNGNQGGDNPPPKSDDPFSDF